MAASPQPGVAAVRPLDDLRPESSPNNVLLMWLSFGIVTVILAFVATMMYWATTAQMRVYERGVEAAMSGQVNHSAAITYSRAITYAVVKTSSVFLAFLLIFLGSIYVLMPKQSSYGLTVESQGAKGSLESSSPGLIMMTLGVALAIAALSIQSNINYTEQGETVSGPAKTGGPVQVEPVPSKDYAEPPSSRGKKK